MGLNKGFKVNVKANLKTTEGNSIYLDLKDGGAYRVRFLPPNRADGALFTKVVNHFGYKTDDEPPRGTALACLDHFKDEECYACKLSRKLQKDGDRALKELGKKIRDAASFYAQVLVAEKQPDGTFQYIGPKLLRLPKTAVEAVNGILINQDEAGDDFFCDPDGGQDLMVSRTGTGFSTKYNIMATGKKNKLDEIFPDWATSFIDDVEEAVGLNLLSYDDQREAAVRSFGDEIPWQDLAEEGL